MFAKSIALAAAAVALTATTASANAFGIGESQPSKSVVELELVIADAPGTVEVYEYSFGQPGELLGTTEVMAGANADVRVNVGNSIKHDIVAVLRVDGEVVATRDFDTLR